MSNTTGELLWVNSPDTGTHFWVRKDTVTWRIQHRTPATVPTAFHKKPRRMLSRVRQRMCRRLCHTPKISQKFTGEWKFGLLRYGRDENHTGPFNFGSIISRHLFVKAFDNVNVNYLKIPEKHRGPHKRPLRATCSPLAACLRPLTLA